MAKREWIFSKTLLTDVAFQLGVFLLFVPVFFFLAKQDLLDNEAKYGIIYAYITTRLFRAFLTVLVGIVIRKKRDALLTCNEKMRRTAFAAVLACGVVSAFLYGNGCRSAIYYSLARKMGVFDLSHTPMAITVLWEQLFDGYLWWSLLLSFAIILFPSNLRRSRLNCQLQLRDKVDHPVPDRGER